MPDDCSCDPGVPETYKVHSESDCLRTQCLVYTTATTWAFLFVTLYLVLLLVHTLRLLPNQWNSLRTVILYILTAFSTLRVIRFAILTTLEHPEDISRGYQLFLSILFALPLILNFVAWSLLASIWMRLYQLVNEAQQRRTLLTKRVLFVYFSVVFLVSTIWVIIVIRESVNDNNSILINYYTGIICLVVGILFLIAGRRFMRTIKASAAVNQRRFDEFQRMHNFIMSVTIVWLITVICLFAFGTSILWLNTMEYFLIRNGLYRLFEIMQTCCMAVTYQPALSELFCGVRKNPDTTTYPQSATEPMDLNDLNINNE